jgi:hypothetical protein
MPEVIDESVLKACVAEIEVAAASLRRAVAGLDERQLDTPYRPGGWSVRQVVHHVPDSHLNAYLRFKFALTEDEPTIRPYDEKLWAELPEAKTGPVQLSLDLLESLHSRWVACIRALQPASLDRTFRHPELGVMSIKEQLALYAWHGRHHVAQIVSLRARQAWTI